MQRKIARVGFHGGPGLGKSTAAAYSFSKLKKCGVEVELVTEYIKSWTFIDREPERFDQFFVFANQLHAEDIILRNESSMVVTDSPLFTNLAYAFMSNSPCSKQMKEVVREFELQYPSLIISLDRDHRRYSERNRYHTLAQAKEIDKRMDAHLEMAKNEGLVTYVETVGATNWETIDSILIHYLLEEDRGAEPGPNYVCQDPSEKRHA